MTLLNQTSVSLGTSHGGAEVEFRSVSRRFGAVAAVDNVSFRAARGEFLTLLGPSGSGKSTLLMLLAGFDQPTSGEILIDGRPMSHVPVYARNQGIVFQSYALFPHMTVEQNLNFPLSVRGIAPNRRGEMIDQALERVRMSDFKHRFPHQLSGGQQQRIAMARAVVFDPPVLLMDEPLSALDRNLREEMQFELSALHASLSSTIIYVTHDQREAVTMSDRIAVMQAGRIVQFGTPRDIYDRPTNAFVAGFIGETNLIECVVGGRSGPGYQVTAGGTELLVGDGEELKPGAAALVAVRPETIRLLRASETGRDENNALNARVEQAVFLGDSVRYVINTGHQRLTVKQQTDPAGFVFAAEENVRAVLHPQAMRLLARPE